VRHRPGGESLPTGGGSCMKAKEAMRMLARKFLVVSTVLLASPWGAASIPLPPSPLPPDIRLTINVSMKEARVDLSALSAVYRALEGAAARAALACHPTMKDYEKWRAKGFEPNRRVMVCGAAHSALIGGSWGSGDPETIIIDVRITSKEEANVSRIDRFVAELEDSLKADPSVMTVMQDTWSPEHSWLNIK
jgi:hypothetical protein